MSATITGLLITPEGDPEEVTVNGDDHLADYYRLLGCKYVDVVRLNNDLDAWIDDEGNSDGAEPNPLASAVIHALGPDWILPRMYRGPVLFLNVDQSTGDSVSISAANGYAVAELAVGYLLAKLGESLGATP